MKYIRQYTVRSPLAELIINNTSRISTTVGIVTSAYFAMKFNYGYTHFPLATLSLHASLTAASILASSASLFLLATLLDKNTYVRLTHSAQYWSNAALFRTHAAQQILLKQYAQTPDPTVKMIYAQRHAFHALEENKADKAFLALGNTLKEPAALDLLGRIFTSSTRLRHRILSIPCALGIPFHTLATGITDITLAGMSVFEKNHDFALRIFYNYEKKHPEHRAAVALLSSLIHTRMNSEHTPAAYRYSAACAALQDHLLSPAGTSIRAKIIDPKKHAFLANNFVYYFGSLQELCAQEQNRKHLSTVLDKHSCLPQLICPPTTIDPLAFSTYQYAQGIPLSESHNKQHYHHAAQLLGRIHARLVPQEKPRDYRTVLTERISKLPSRIAQHLFTAWNALWNYLGNDTCFDRDSHGKNYSIADHLTLLDFKPRPANHRMLDLVKLGEHTCIFGEDYTERHHFFDQYTRGSSKKPEIISYLCAVPLVAINSFYFHSIEHREPGFCQNYLSNARLALRHLKKTHPFEHQQHASSFESIDTALTLAQKQALSTDPSSPACAV